MTDGDQGSAGRTLTGMTDTDARPKRFTWGISSVWNRAAYAFVVAVLVNLAWHSTPLALAVGLALFLLLTAIVFVGRRRD